MLIKIMAAKLTAASASEGLFFDFLSEIEPKKVSEALKHLGWVDAMQEELNQFCKNEVWTLVSLPYEKITIGSKWVFRNKKDEHGIVTKNKARLVTQGYSQEKGIDYDETFAPMARMEAITIFLAFVTYMTFIIFQMDVKSAFLNGKLKEEVYVKQPPVFESSEFPDYICKLDKALYGLKQAPNAWYETLSTFLSQNKFVKGRIDNTLLLVQVYMDNIIFGSTSYILCKQFEKPMTKKFKMSMIGELTYFLRLQIKQDDKGVSICQEQYTRNLLKKYEISDSSSVKILMVPLNNLGPDLAGKQVNETLYKGMTGSLLYLTAIRDTQTQTMLVVIWTEKALQVPVKSLEENWFVGVPRNSSKWLSEAEYVVATRVQNQVFSDEWQESLTLDYNTFVHSTGLDYSPGTYVSHPSLKAVKAELAKIVLSGSYSYTEHINSIQQMIAYCLITGTKVDIGEIIYSDLITKLTSKSRQKYGSYLRSILCALKVLLGTQYTQDEKFRSLPSILSNSNFSKDPSEVTEIELTVSMIDTQGPKASGTLPLKRRKAKTDKTTPEATETPPTEDVPIEDFEKTQSVASSQTAHPQDPERNIQLADKGSYSPLNEGTHKSQPLPESTTIDPKDSGGNVKPADKGLPSTVPDKGTGKTKPLSEGPHKDKDLEGFKSPIDIESLTAHVADLLGTDANEDDVFEAGDEIDEDIHHTDEEETQSHSPTKEQHESSHTQETGESDSDSFCPEVLKKYDNTISRKNIRKQLLHMLILRVKFKDFMMLFTKFIEDAVKEDPALNKKVFEATEAYTKNSTSLTELLTDKHRAECAKSSTSMAWNLGPRLTSIKSTQFTLRSEISSLRQDTSDIKSNNFWGKNVTKVATEEPPSHTEGENDDMEIQETEEDKTGKEQELERCRNPKSLSLHYEEQENKMR
ncbi:retrovirus-related pol polyprotein from transposon TNT 1-94 [Tanacetum coccineum]